MIRLYLDGSASPVQAQEAADGTCSISLAGLAPGNHTLIATAQLTGQNASSPTAPRTFQGPPPPVVLPPPPPPVTAPDPQSAGTWANVTPTGINLNASSLILGGQPFEYGAQEVVADPNHPGTLFAGFCYQGIWKSADYGRSWVKLTNGGVLLPVGTGLPTSPDPMDCGRPALAISPDGSCLLCTMLYPIGAGQNGCWKSSVTDTGGLGAKWRRITVGAANGDDVGSFHFDPGDPLHVVAIPHSQANGASSFFESHDAGEHWTPQPLAPGAVQKLNFIGPGRLLCVYDWGSGTAPQLGLFAGGAWAWVPVVTHDEKGNAVAGQTAFHGAQQVVWDAANSAAYIGGPQGIHRSVDGGKSWVQLATPGNLSEGLAATGKAIYSTSSFASGGGFQVNFQSGPRDPAASGSSWKASQVPAAMNNGWVGAAVVNDGTRSAILAGCWDAGLWRFVEA